MDFFRSRRTNAGIAARRLEDEDILKDEADEDELVFASGAGRGTGSD